MSALFNIHSQKLLASSEQKPNAKHKVRSAAMACNTLQYAVFHPVASCVRSHAFTKWTGAAQGEGEGGVGQRMCTYRKPFEHNFRMEMLGQRAFRAETHFRLENTNFLFGFRCSSCCYRVVPERLKKKTEKKNHRHIDVPIEQLLCDLPNVINTRVCGFESILLWKSCLQERKKKIQFPVRTRWGKRWWPPPRIVGCCAICRQYTNSWCWLEHRHIST